MIDMLPRQLADVDQSVHAAEVDECAERHDRGHCAFADLANLEVVEELIAGLFLILFEVRTTRQHNVVAVLVELDDLGVNGFADIRREIAHSTEFDERCWQEAAQADVDDEATLDNLDDRPGDDFVGFFLGFDIAPSALVLCTLLRENEAALFVFLRQYECLDRLAERDDFGRVDVVTDAQFTRRDDTLAFVTNVEQNFVLVDLDDGAVHHLAIFDRDHGAVDCVGERHAEVIGYDLAGGVVALVVKRSKWGSGGLGGGSGIGQGTDCFQNGYSMDG